MSEHVKAAASSLVDFFQTDNIPLVSRIERNDILEVRNIISDILNYLISVNLIKDIQPKYTLGSTRLIAHDLGSFDAPHDEYETYKIYKDAILSKNTFGDVDIDVEAIGTMKEIGESLKQNFSPNILYRLCGSNEVNLAVRNSYNKVWQIDIVNVTGKRLQMEFNQFSSWLDLTYGLKGLVRDILVTSIAKTTPVSEYEMNIIQQGIKNNLSKIKEICKVTDKDQVILEQVRWSLGHEELKLLLVYKKIKNGKELRTPINVLVSDLDFDVDADITYNIKYTKFNMMSIASKIGISSDTVLYHSMLMLKEIKQFDIDRRQAVWNSVIKTLNRKRPSDTAGGQLSNEEADKAIEIMKPYFEGVNYDSANE